MTARDRDYVLGTHDDEIARLGVQHAVWRSRAIDAWRRAGFGAGDTLLDVGSGPGYATLDLAELAGPSGRVIAVDRSRRFLDTLQTFQRERGIRHVEVVESDLDVVDFGEGVANGAWCRWVLAFVPRPFSLLERIGRALKPGAAFVSHEYFDYASWRVLPRSAVFEEFVQLVIANWRKSGGEPDVALDVPRWLERLGFEVELTAPRIEAITRDDDMWQWPASFIDVGLRRLIDLGAIDPDSGRAMQSELDRIVASPSTRMITPGVLEVIARKRSSPVSS
ncbi:MAG TPA: class I SAM-dependent methyltransferase [Gemmatimonadaceae bacterium]|jgi:SAM-dependent methyltransferase|nr:class I SAM-dependent methyltransferase [Gemmatimonadaceae bacterium]